MQRYGKALLRFPFVILVVCTCLHATPKSTRSFGFSLKGKAKIHRKSTLTYHDLNESPDISSARVKFLEGRRGVLIRNLEILLRRGKGDRTEMKERLARLYLEEYHGALAADQGPSRAQQWAQKARLLFAHLVKKYPQHPHRDEFLHFLGEISFDNGDIKSGTAYFKELSQKYAQSRYAIDANLQMGDRFFNDNKMKLAAAEYDKVIESHDPATFPYALYKKGWCRYNSGSVDEALRLFKQAIQVEEGSPNGIQLRIRSEVAKDIVYPFVDLNGQEEAVHFFESLGDDYYRPGVESVALRTLERGEYEKAISIWEELLSRNTVHANNPMYELSIVQAYNRMDQKKHALSRLVSAARRYLGDTSWKKENFANAQLLNEIQSTWEASIRGNALQVHREAQVIRNESYYKMARILYREYLTFFPENPHAAEVRFNLAETLSREKRHLEAAEYYRMAGEGYRDSKLSEKSFRLALVSLSKTVHELNPKGVSEETEGAIPFTKEETLFAKAVESYLSAFPKSDYCPEVAFDLALLNFERRHFDSAREKLAEGINLYPQHAVSKRSALLLLDVLNRQKSYAEILTVGRGLLNDPRLSLAASQRREVVRVLRETELKSVALLEEEKEYEAAGRGYLRYFESYGAMDPKSSEKALFNAGVNLDRAGLEGQALSAREHFLKAYPKSPFRKEVEENLLNLYVRTGNLESEEALLSTMRVQKGIPAFQYLSYSLRVADLRSRRTGAPSSLLLANAYQFAIKHQVALKKDPSGADALGRLRHWKLEEKAKEFHALRLAGTQQRMEKILTRKLTMLKEMETQATKQISLGGEWGLAAMASTAAVFREMASEVESVPIPPALSDSEAKEYRERIKESLVRPFNEKAFSLSSRCVELADRHKIVSSWVTKCHDQASLSSENPPPARQVADSSSF